MWTCMKENIFELSEINTLCSEKSIFELSEYILKVYLNYQK